MEQRAQREPGWAPLPTPGQLREPPLAHAHPPWAVDGPPAGAPGRDTWMGEAKSHGEAGRPDAAALCESTKRGEAARPIVRSHAGVVSAHRKLCSYDWGPTVGDTTPCPGWPWLLNVSRRCEGDTALEAAPLAASSDVLVMVPVPSDRSAFSVTPSARATA